MNRLRWLLVISIVLAASPADAAQINGGGGGTVTSVDATQGVETVSGSPITATGTIRGAELVNAQTGTTYTYLTGDRGKLVTHTNAAAIAGTLPQASASFPSGWYMDVQNRGAGTLTITPTTSTIDGAASLALTTNQGVRVVSDGTNYFTQRGVGAAGIGGTVGTTDNRIPRSDGVGGATLQASGVTIDDSNNITVPGTITTGSGGGVTGSVTWNGATSGGITITPLAASGQIITMTNAAQTVGAASITIPDLAGVSQTPTYNALAATLTGKSYDAEGTGNVLTVPRRLWFPAAGINNATAGSIWDLPTTNPAVVGTRTGTNTTKGVLDFADGANTLTASIMYMLPATWVGAVDARVYWENSSATLTGDVVWQIAIACAGDGESDDPAYTDDAFTADTVKGTANLLNITAVNTVTTTGTCAADKLAHIRLARNPAHASDTFLNTARFIGLELVIREAI